MLRTVFTFFIVAIMISLTGCAADKDKVNSAPVPLAYQQYCDSVDQMILRFYYTDPDSAERMLLKNVTNNDSSVYPARRINTYLLLAELYQYRKPDYLKSMEIIGEVVRFIVDNPVHYMDNPYMYIDIGNVLLRFHYFGESVSFYRIALNVAERQSMWHGKALAMQNIALCRAEQMMYDSAIYYLNLADGEITDRTHMLLAQNQEYLAEILLRLNRTEEIDQLLYHSFNILVMNDIRHNTLLSGKRLNDYFAWFEIMARLKDCQAKYYLRMNFPDHARSSHDSAVFYARKALSAKLLAEIFYTMALHSGSQRATGTFIADMDSASLYISKINDLELHRNFADSMARLCRVHGLSEKSETFRRTASLKADSLIRQKASYGLIKNLAHMMSLATIQAFKQLKIEEAARSGVVSAQRRALVILVLALILIGVFTFLIYMQKKKLNTAYNALLIRIQSSLEYHERIKDKKKGKIHELDISHEFLEKVIAEEKLFLKEDLTLSELAGLLKTNPTYLSRFLHKRLNTDFNNYINSYRIREACRLLNRPEIQKNSIDALPGMVGFHSKSTFYTAFKKHTGMTPSSYLKLLCQHKESAEDNG